MIRFLAFVCAAALLGGCAASVPPPASPEHPASPDAAAGPLHPIPSLSAEGESATSAEATTQPMEGHHHGH